MTDVSLSAVQPQSTATPRRALPLERTLPLLVLGLFSLVLAISLAASYYEIRHSAMRSASERVSSLSKVLGSLLGQQVSGRIAQLERVAHDSAVQHALQAPSAPLSAAAARAMATLLSGPTDSLVPQLWTANGRRVGQPLSLERPADAQAVRDAVQHMGSSRDTEYVSPMQTVAGRARFWEVVSVRGDSARTLGYVVQERQVGSNPRTLKPLRDLVGSDIDVYFRNGDAGQWVQLTGASASPPTTRRRYADSLELLTHADKGEMLAASAPVMRTPFSVTVERSVDGILERPLATMRVLIVLAIVLAVVGAWVVWVLSRALVRPLGELTRAAEGIAHGRYAERVQVRGADELQRLGAAFNRMAREVEDASAASQRAVRELTVLADNQRFVADASGILAGSLSDETMIGALARCCVPRIADYCSIHIAGDDGAIRRLDTVHADPERQRLVRELVKRYEHRLDTPSEVATVIQSQRPLLVGELDLDAVRRSVPDEIALELLDVVRPRSFMCVPLVARGRSFGAMSFTMTESGRRFTEADVEFAMELAQRTALAIDNAVIYRRSLELRLEAEAASSAKSDFLAKMSHEIRTPINAMMGYAELIQLGIAGPVTPAQVQHLERIRASGDHLTSLVNEILDLAKIEAGRMGVQPTVGIAGDAAEAALTMIRPQAAAKGIELASSVEGATSVEYFGDPQRVQQILMNLLSNAVKFTPSGGRVSVSCGAERRPPTGDHGDDAEWSWIAVSDTGAGIAAQDLERIFHPFVQADAGYTRAHGGTGLGLTISRNLAHMMGGDITVTSEPGKGSRFTLRLPCPIRAIAAS